MAVLMAALLLCWVVGNWRGAQLAPVSLGRIRAFAVPFLVVAGWMLVQTLPLGGLLANPLWGEAATALASENIQSIHGAISLAPYDGRTALMRLASYGIAFWLALQLARDEAMARAMMRWLAIICVLYAAVGLFYYYNGIERILWIPKWAYLGDATGTFVNRNAYGAQMALGVVLCLGLCLHAFRPHVGETPMERLRRLIKGGGWLLGGGLCLLAVLASHSRGALLACAIAGFVLLLALAFSGSIRRGTLFWVIAVVFAGAAAILIANGEATLQRFVGGSDFQGDRPNLVRLSWALVQGAPWLGYGLGAFEPALSIVRDITLPRPVAYEFAHNMYMEALVELGVPAAILWWSGFVLLGWRFLSGLMRRRHRLYSALGLAILALFGSHAVVDFSIAMPALALMAAILLGIACAQSWSSREDLSTRA
ncbi:MAG: O-antigen ligase family protein [Alphaproteobacteria bacterium]|nr:O-antigen ligase family protein [Alphaproteobacteria bacterium]MBU0796818.1 O-antigen ligase family protein [Alphaproteobacteria bacterium]MBU0885824.1 O-antigen ligase family protein [Alphaproteobacteria bacterium]MBU1812099.1 O-antigen ligase family protein [Alphaproteobacteria bacterium]